MFQLAEDDRVDYLGSYLVSLYTEEVIQYIEGLCTSVHETLSFDLDKGSNRIEGGGDRVSVLFAVTFLDC